MLNPMLASGCPDGNLLSAMRTVHFATAIGQRNIMSQFTIGDPWQCRNAFAKLSEKEPALGLIVADCAQVARHDEKALGFKTDLQTPAPEQAANEQAGPDQQD